VSLLSKSSDDDRHSNVYGSSTGWGWVSLLHFERVNADSDAAMSAGLGIVGVDEC